jgi:hypothetical protein
MPIPITTMGMTATRKNAEKKRREIFFLNRIIGIPFSENGFQNLGNYNVFLLSRPLLFDLGGFSFLKCPGRMFRRRALVRFHPGNGEAHILKLSCPASNERICDNLFVPGAEIISVLCNTFHCVRRTSGR